MKFKWTKGHCDDGSGCWYEVKTAIGTFSLEKEGPNTEYRLTWFPTPEHFWSGEVRSTATYGTVLTAAKSKAQHAIMNFLVRGYNCVTTQDANYDGPHTRR